MFRNGTSHTVYLDGASNATATYTPSGVQNLAYFGLSLDGRLTSMKIFSAALTQPEIDDERQFLGVRRTANLTHYFSFLGSADIVNYAGAAVLTANGTPTTGEGPSVPWGPSRTHVIAAMPVSLLPYLHFRPMLHMLVR
jgi:hypothetical protein